MAGSTAPQEAGFRRYEARDYAHVAALWTRINPELAPR
jgi:hypothetical protein